MMMTKTMTNEVAPRILVETPNGKVEERAYHVTTMIAEVPGKMFLMPLRESSKAPMEETGAVGSKLIERLGQIPGVTHVSLYPYAVYVTRGKAFKWREIHSEVITAIKACFGDNIKQMELNDTYVMED
jgi:hypothetical protein